MLHGVFSSLFINEGHVFQNRLWEHFAERWLHLGEKFFVSVLFDIRWTEDGKLPSETFHSMNQCKNAKENVSKHKFHKQLLVEFELCFSVSVSISAASCHQKEPPGRLSRHDFHIVRPKRSAS